VAGRLAEIADSFFRPAVNDLVPYEPGKPVEEVQRELGLERVVKLASNEGPYGPFASRSTARSLSSTATRTAAPTACGPPWPSGSTSASRRSPSALVPTGSSTA